MTVESITEPFSSSKACKPHTPARQQDFRQPTSSGRAPSQAHGHAEPRHRSLVRFATGPSTEVNEFVVYLVGFIDWAAGNASDGLAGPRCLQIRSLDPTSWHRPYWRCLRLRPAEIRYENGSLGFLCFSASLVFRSPAELDSFATVLPRVHRVGQGSQTNDHRLQSCLLRIDFGSSKNMPPQA